MFTIDGWLGLAMGGSRWRASTPEVRCYIYIAWIRDWAVDRWVSREPTWICAVSARRFARPWVGLRLGTAQRHCGFRSSAASLYSAPTHTSCYHHDCDWNHWSEAKNENSYPCGRCDGADRWFWLVRFRSGRITALLPHFSWSSLPFWSCCNHFQVNFQSKLSYPVT